MRRRAGQRLNHYEILGLLGAGGMGEVYRARDLRLEREVALKLLPADLSSDPEWFRRFEGEAKALAKLSHPNVAVLYELGEAGGERYLALELVDGEPLSERLARGRLQLPEALETARQIAAALEATHDRRIVHRDLKPGNVMLTPSGLVKVLDFGLAKSTGRESTPGFSTAPTHRVTAAGALLGTPAYMSPEQARGLAVDRRTDLWALGCLLFECLGGSPAFDGETVSDVLVGVLSSDVDWGKLPAPTPRAVRLLLGRLLAKDPEKRLRDAADVRIELEQLLEEPADEVPAVLSRREHRGRTFLLGALLGLVVAVVVAGVLLRGAKPPDPVGQRVVSFAVPLPDGVELVGSDFALAPDDTSLAFAATDGAGETKLFVRHFDRDAPPKPVPGTEGATTPFYSPDARWLGFYAASGGLRKVAVEGGPALRIVDAPATDNRSAAWGPDGTIAFTLGIGNGLAGVEASHGEYSDLTELEHDRGEVLHWSPQWLPGGRKLLHSSWGAQGLKTFVRDLETGERELVLTAGVGARYLPGGILAYGDSGSLAVVPCDPETFLPVGSSSPVLGDVRAFVVSPRGSLLYTRGRGNRREIVRVDQSGEREVLPGPAEPIHQARLSPNGEHLVVSHLTSVLSLEIVDLVAGTRRRLPSEGTVNNYAVWSPDGKQVAYNSLRSSHGIYLSPVDGSSESELLLAKAERGNRLLLPGSWSPDGQFLLYTEARPGADADVAALWLADHRVEEVVATSADEHSPRLSPDGAWLAYVSDASGREEVYARPLRGPSRDWKVSDAGGVEPVWSSDGRSLLYRSGQRILQAEFDQDRRAPFGAPQLRYESARLADPDPGAIMAMTASYDVGPEGELLVLEASGERRGDESLHVALGWSGSVRRQLSLADGGRRSSGLEAPD